MNFEQSNLSRVLLVVFCLASPIQASPQVSDPSQTSSSRKWEIVDNSFLVEEAFNQEAGVAQNIFTWTLGHHGSWIGSFTQEWPAPGIKHQLSYSLSIASTGDAAGIGDVVLNYRYQLRDESAGGPAISPRLSLILPTGSEADGLGGGTTGMQLNLPLSKQFGNFYVHANAGYTWLPGVQHTTLVAGSVIWRVAPMLNLLLEGVEAFDASMTLSPGFRRGWNFGERQLVIGAAAPVTRVDGRWTAALLTYLSYELPFR